MKKSLTTKILIICLIQIFLVVSLSITTSISISKTNKIEIKENSIIQEEIITNLLEKGFDFLIGFFSISQIGTVSAADIAACCEKVVGGGYCQDVEDASMCETGINSETDDNYDMWLMNCSEINDEEADCAIGYCYDDETGTCTGGAPHFKCKYENGGEWSFKIDDILDKCEKGCCKLDANTQPLTYRECEILSEELGRDGVSFIRDIPAEACIYEGSRDDYGACLFYNSYGQEDCEHTSEFLCKAKQDAFIGFKKGELCSSVFSGCSPMEYIGCDKDEKLPEIYWYDSCGNKENIYDYSKRNDPEYRTTMIPKSEICGYEDNIKGIRECGNCGHDFETLCVEADNNKGVFDAEGENGEEYICGGTECSDPVFEEVFDRKPINGESWCVYDSVVGGGKDIPGSLHWIRNCENGIVKQDVCGGDYRSQICAQSNRTDFAQAECRFNQGFMCFMLEGKEECEDNEDCYWKEVDIDDGFEFDICLPQYPKGFNFKEALSDDKEICESIETAVCTVVYSKYRFEFWSDYHCDENCGCLEDNFFETMNDICISLGDCGSNINIEGVYSKNSDVSRTYATMSSLHDLVSNDMEINPSANIDENNDRYGANTPTFIGGGNGDWGGAGIQNEDFHTPQPHYKWFGDSVYHASKGVGYVTGGAALLKELGVKFMSKKLLASLANPAIAIAAIIVMLLFTKLIKEKEVKFSCDLWRPPAGGDDCSKCNSDPDKPCTAYRCESLGTSCRILGNEAVQKDNPTCYSALEEDTTPPVVSSYSVKSGLKSVDYDNKKGMYIYKDTATNECIDQHSKIKFTVKVNESSRCKWGTTDYPNFESFRGEDVSWLTDGQYSTLHELEVKITQDTTQKIFIKCENPSRLFNVDSFEVEVCVTPEPDLQAPVIEGFDPPSFSYVANDVVLAPFYIYLDEDAECRYSNTAGTAYEYMNNMSIATGTDILSANYEILHGLDINGDTNTIYIKCNDTYNNINSIDTEYTLLRSEPLFITHLLPENDSVREYAISETDPLEIYARTSGGAQNGKAVCFYRYYVDVFMFKGLFANTNKTEHKQIIDQPLVGNMTVEVSCEDLVGNTAVNKTNFAIDLDLLAPNIVRVLKIGNKLRIITDEDAYCHYVTEEIGNCGFSLTQDNMIGYGGSTYHELDWNPEHTYYIKCEDEYGNYHSNCPIIVRPSDVI